jgi:hypothetical protein
MDDIVTPASSVNVLEEHAVAIKNGCRAFHDMGQNRIDIALAVGKHVIAVQERIGRGLRAWLKEWGLNKTDCYDFMLLARNEESVRSSGHSSVAAALRMLRKSSGSPRKAKEAKSQPDGISWWKRASDPERTGFLDGVGISDFRQAMSLTFYRQLRDLVRVEKIDSTPSGKGTRLLKKALSHLKAADKPEMNEIERTGNLNEACSSLRAILKVANGDPHCVNLGFDAAKSKKAVAA